SDDGRLDSAHPLLGARFSLSLDLLNDVLDGQALKEPYATARSRTCAFVIIGVLVYVYGIASQYRSMSADRRAARRKRSATVYTFSCCCEGFKVEGVVRVRGGRLMSLSKRRLQVFLCHSSGDKPVVRELYRLLRSEGFDPWLDEKNLIAGQDWQLEISL